jgi:hypothetical protein
MKDLLRIASKLDEIGDFQLSDKLIKIAQGILAAPQPTIGKPTAILAPPVARPIDSGICALVSGIYSKDIATMKNFIREELSTNQIPFSTSTKSQTFIMCISKSGRYFPKQLYAFQNQSYRIKEELSDTSKSQFYQIIYPLLKQYKVTENDLHLYKNKEEFSNQFGRMSDDLFRKLSISGLTDPEFQKTNEYKFLTNTYSILTQRFKK